MVRFLSILSPLTTSSPLSLISPLEMDSKNEDKYDSKSSPLDYSGQNELPTKSEEGQVRQEGAETENQPKGSDVSSSLKWWTEEEDKQVRWKLDRVCVPLMFMAYGLSTLDRGNIGSAKVAGMPEDLEFDDDHYQWLLTIFYIFYSSCQFLIFGYKLVRPHIWVAFAMTAWGLASILQSAAFGWGGLMACRAFLGASEACYGTGIVLYLSFHYPKKEIGFRFAIVIAAGALSSCISGSLAYGITSIKHSSVATWRLLFLIEGIPTLFAAALVFFCLPDSPLTAKFLTPREREIADARRFAAQVDKTDGKGFLSQVDWKNAATAFKSPVSYLNASLLFINNVGYSSLPVYLPKIIKEMGYSSINAQGYSAPPYLVAFVFSLCIIFVSDRLQIRGPFIMVMMTIGGVGYLMLALTDEYALNVHTRYAACYLVALSLFTNISLTYMWLISNQAGDSKRGAGLAIFATVGQCGPFLGTRIFPDDDAPYYTKGTAISGGLLFFGVILAACGTVGFWYSNRKRTEAEARLGSNVDNETAVAPNQEIPQGMADFDVRGVTDKFELERRAEDVARRGEDSPYFRYTI